MSPARSPGVKRLGAVGTMVWDRIWHPAGSGPIEQWGGMTYSLASLSATCPADWRIVPLLKLGSDMEARAREHLRRLPHVVVEDGVRPVAQPNNQVELRYLDGAERDERQIGGVPGWTFPELEPLLPGLDALYVNFLSGFELDLDSAERLRASFAGPLYADLHSLFLGPPGPGPRQRRPLPDAERWLACFDVIQMNEVELALLTGGAGGELELPRLLDHGPRVVLVTLGERGVRYAARAALPLDPTQWAEPPAGREVVQGTVEPPDGPVPGDPTGCGDVWGSALFTSLLCGLGLEPSIQRAQRAAAAKIRHPVTASLHDSIATALA